MQVTRACLETAVSLQVLCDSSQALECSAVSQVSFALLSRVAWPLFVSSQKNCRLLAELLIAIVYMCDCILSLYINPSMPIVEQHVLVTSMLLNIKLFMHIWPAIYISEVGILMLVFLSEVESVQKVLTITVTGLAAIPGVEPNPFESSNTQTIFEGTVNELPGSSVSLSVAVSNADDPRYRQCLAPMAFDRSLHTLQHPSTAGS